jgi:hypothetical protein
VNGVSARSTLTGSLAILDGEMTQTRSEHHPGSSRTRDEEPTSDKGFLVGFSTFAFGMLALFAVLAIAGELGLGGVLPFFVVPLALFVESFLIFWRWGTAEAETAALREARSRREPGKPWRTAPRGAPASAHERPAKRVRESGSGHGAPGSPGPTVISLAPAQSAAWARRSKEMGSPPDVRRSHDRRLSRKSTNGGNRG